MLGRRKLSEGAVNNSTQLSTIFWIQGFCLLLVVFFLTLEIASLNPAKPITNKLRGKLQLCLDFGVSPRVYFLHWMKRKKKISFWTGWLSFITVPTTLQVPLIGILWRKTKNLAIFLHLQDRWEVLFWKNYSWFKKIRLDKTPQETSSLSLSLQPNRQTCLKTSCHRDSPTLQCSQHLESFS